MIHSPSGAHAGAPRNSIDSVRTRTFVPSSSITHNRVRPCSSITNAMARPFRAIDGPPTIRALGAVHSSVAVPAASFQIPSLPLLEDTYSRKFAPSRGASPPAVGSLIGLAADSSATWSDIGTRQRVPFVLATVATRRRPSALAASDVYCSRPKLTRCGMRRSRSKAYNAVRAPSAVVARYSSVR